jgi:hypothetical protein
VHLFPRDRDRRFVSQVAAQLVVALVPAPIGLTGGTLILASDGRLGTDLGRVLQAIGLGCVGVALLVLLSTLVNALREQRERL